MITVHRAQGAISAYQRLKKLREYVNATNS